MSTNNIQSWYNFALQQMAAESYLNLIGTNGLSETDILMLGSNNPLFPQNNILPSPNASVLAGATRMTPTQAADFTARYTIVSQLPDTASGFSAALIKDNQTGAYTLSIRSTEYRNADQGGDWPRDGLPGADGEIGTHGFAFGQIASMEGYYQHLQNGESYQDGQWVKESREVRHEA